LALKCPRCGTENEEYAIFCSSCRQPLQGQSDRDSLDTRQSRVAIAAFGLFVAILLAAMLIFIWFSLPAEQNGNHGALVITLLNPTSLDALPCEYVLELNGLPEHNGTVPAGESDVVEKNFTFDHSSLVVVVHVQVIDSTTQPEDVIVTITPGEIERVTVFLHRSSG